MNMNEFNVCVACLSMHNRVHRVKNTHYHQIYEGLANLSLNQESGLPDTICYICYSQLLRCYKFMEKAQESGRKLTQLLQNTHQLTQELVLSLDEKANHNLVTSILKPISFLQGENQESGNTGEIKKVDVDDSPMNGIINTVAANEVKISLYLKEEPVELAIEDEMVTIKDECIISIEPTQYEGTSIKLENYKAKKLEMEVDMENQVDNKEMAKTDDNSKVKEKCIKKVKDLKSHVCATCGAAFFCKSYLNRHERTHTGERPFACKICDKTFAQNSHLNQHMRLHTGERPYTCHICKNKSFSARYNYRTHMRKHFGVPTHKCDVCTSVFHRNADLKRHVLTHTGEKPHTCDICDMKFSQSGHLKQHIRKHSKYTCTDCDVTFSQKSEFNNHITTHSGSKQYTCHVAECSKSFNRKFALSKHLKTHSEDRPYTCNVCCKTFKKQGHLTKHNNSMIHRKTRNITDHNEELHKDDVDSEHKKVESEPEHNEFESKCQVKPRVSDNESQETPKVQAIAQNHEESKINEDMCKHYLYEQEEYIIP